MSTTISPFPVRHLQLSNGCNIAYVDEGSGTQTLVFIHGLATYALCWKKNIESLRSHYRCIAVDLPGNGFSDRNDHPYGISFFSACLHDFIMQLGLTDVCLIGHSMGGQVAIHLAAHHPQLINKLALCAPAGFETFTSVERTLYQSTIGFLDFFSTDENSLRQTIQSSFYNTSPYTGEMINELVGIMKQHSVAAYRKMIEKCIHGMLHEPVFDLLKKIQQPALVMFGDRDALIPNPFIHHLTPTSRIAEQGTQEMHNAKLVMIASCGHFLQIEKADVVNGLIHEFLKD